MTKTAQSAGERSAYQTVSEDLPLVLVAGGAGFIGHHLIKLLLQQNCIVYCIDNLFTGDEKNLAIFKDNRNFKFYKHDLTKPLEKLGLPYFDYIFHLAGSESFFQNTEADLKTLMVNSLGTRNLLDLAKKQQAKFLLVSSANVFSGLISQEDINNYFGKKEDGQSFYSLAEAKRFSESLVFEYFYHHQLNCRIVRILDVYGPYIPLNSNNIIIRLFNQLINESELKLPGDGGQLIYPTFVSDLTLGLLKAMFNQDSVGKIYTLANAQAISILDFSHDLNNISGQTKKIVFVADNMPFYEVDISEFKRSQEDLGWTPKTALEDGLKLTYDWLSQRPTPVVLPVAKVKPVEPIAEQPIKTKSLPIKTKMALPFKFPKINLKLPFIKLKINQRKFNTRNTVLFLAFFLLLLLLTVALPTIGFRYYLQRGLKQFNENQIADSILSFNKSRRVIDEFGPLIFLAVLGANKKDTIDLLNLNNHVLEAELKQQKADEYCFNIIRIVFKGERGDANGEIVAAKTYFDQSYQDLSIVESELGQLDKQGFGKGPMQQLKLKLQSFKNDISDIRKKLNLSRELLTVTPQLLSSNKKKTYLVLMQDNLELRPSGGYINSFGFLTMDKGRVLDFNMEEVDTADSQLRGHVTPPWALKKYLGESSWFLRDANWDPDFPSSALQAEWFIDKELGKQVDGTIGLTVNFLQAVLEQLGPIQLTDFNETITSGNLVERALAYAQVDNVDSSGKKENFLNQVITMVFEKMKKMGSDDWFKMFNAIYTGVNEKQLLLSFHDADINNFFDKYGWNGAVRASGTISNTNLTDYLMLVEANFGVNKANYYLERSMDHEVTILPQGDLLENLTINLNNTATNQGWPAGDYKNYLRIYLPTQTRLLNLQIGQNPDILKPIGEKNIDYFDEHGKTGIGILITIPTQEKRVIKITYQPPQIFNQSQKNLSYAFLWQKQAGTIKDKIKLTVNYPDTMKILRVVPRAEVQKNQLEFTSDLAQDRLFIMDFKR